MVLYCIRQHNEKVITNFPLKRCESALVSQERDNKMEKHFVKSGQALTFDEFTDHIELYTRRAMLLISCHKYQLQRKCLECWPLKFVILLYEARMLKYYYNQQTLFNR